MWLERDDIQGLLLSGYARQPLARYFFVTFAGGDARGFLAEILNRISSARRSERDEERRLNVAFTVSGLGALGVPEVALQSFSLEFYQGMSHPERSSVLRDIGPDAPAGWELGGDGTPIDALVLAYGTSEGDLESEVELLESALERHGLGARSEAAYLPADGREHFGFAVAGTNPNLTRFSLRRADNPYDPSVPAGEFVLGYRNARGERVRRPQAPRKQSTRALPPLVDAGRAMDLGKNGSYVALRKLEEDVAGFSRFVDEAGRRVFPEAGDEAGRRFAERLVGRTVDGRSLVLPASDDAESHRSNAFGYRDLDPDGLRCPLGAHVRRANPRDALGRDGNESLLAMRSHRLLRRGRLYGPRVGAGDEPRGLYFMALVASLSQQFEYVSESLLENPKFAGLYAERDPLLGRGEPAGPDTAGEHFSLQGEPYPLTVPLRRFVRVRGGAYLFMPGLRALGYLAEP